MNKPHLLNNSVIFSEQNFTFLERISRNSMPKWPWPIDTKNCADFILIIGSRGSNIGLFAPFGIALTDYPCADKLQIYYRSQSCQRKGLLLRRTVLIHHRNADFRIFP